MKETLELLNRIRQMRNSTDILLTAFENLIEAAETGDITAEDLREFLENASA